MNEQFVKCESVTFAQGGQERKDQDQHRHHRHQCQQGEPHGGPDFLPDQVQRNLQQQQEQVQFEEKRKVSATRRISDSTKRYDGLTTTMMGFAQMEFAKPKNLERAQREIEGDHQ